MVSLSNRPCPTPGASSLCNPNSTRYSPCKCLYPRSLPPPSPAEPPLQSSPSAERGSSVNFTTGVIAIISALGAAFVLVILYTIVAKCCRSREIFRGRSHRHEREAADQPGLVWSVVTRGIDESVIKMIPVCKYSKGEGLVEGTECAVCLSEFEENEALRLLPKCSHAFHLPCIDKWLQTHTNCPICRANVSIPAPWPPVKDVDVGTSSHSSQRPPVSEALEEERGPSSHTEEGNHSGTPEQKPKDRDSDQTARGRQFPVEQGAADRRSQTESEHQVKEPRIVIGHRVPSARYSDELGAAYSRVEAPTRNFSAGFVVNEAEEGRRRHGGESRRGGVWNPKAEPRDNWSSAVSQLRRAYSTSGGFAKDAAAERGSSKGMARRSSSDGWGRGRSSSWEWGRRAEVGAEEGSRRRGSVHGDEDVEAAMREREESDEEEHVKVGKLLQSLKGSFGLTRCWSSGVGGTRDTPHESLP